MKIDTSSLATLKAFNEFAAPGVKKETIARLDAARPLGDGAHVVRGTGDKAYALFRNTESKANNDSVRAAFRNAVGNLFGGEDKIPESVKKAMKPGDYDQGRPLAARRIRTVKTAIAKALNEAGTISDETGFAIRAKDVLRGMGAEKDVSPQEFNRELKYGMQSSDPISKSDLPMEFSRELRTILDETYARFFGAPATEPTPRDFVRGEAVDALLKLIDAADAEGRRVTVEEFTATLKPVYVRQASVAALKDTVNEMAKETGAGRVNPHSVALRHPEIAAELLQCNSPEEVGVCIGRHKETIRGDLNLLKGINEYKAKFLSMVEDAINAGPGRDGMRVKFPVNGINASKITGKLVRLTSSIVKNENDEAKKPGWTLDGAIKKVADIIDLAAQAVYGRTEWRDEGTDGRDYMKNCILYVLFEKTPGLKEAVFSRREEMAQNYDQTLTTCKATATGGRHAIHGLGHNLANILFEGNQLEYPGANGGHP